jgi:RNA polymerase sigma-70 factor (ECF subfamily)
MPATILLVEGSAPVAPMRPLEGLVPGAGALGPAAGTSSQSGPPGPNLGSIFDAELDYVCRSARRLGAREADLEDVAHDVFLVAHERLASFDPTRALRPWLFGITFRVVAAHRRRSARTTTSGDVEELADMALANGAVSEATAEGALIAEQRRRLVERALQALEPDRRAVFVLAELDGQPVVEIARALEIPANTAYSRLRLGRADFAAAVRRLTAGKDGAP